MPPPVDSTVPKKRPLEHGAASNTFPHKRPRVELTTPVPTMTFPLSSRKVTATSAPLSLVPPGPRNAALSTAGKPFKPTKYVGKLQHFFQYKKNSLRL